MLPFLACVLACDATTTPPTDAPSVASVDDDKALDQFEAAPVLIIPPRVVASKRVPRHILIVGDSEACTVAFYAKATVKAINEENHEPYDVVDVECKGGTVVQYWGAGGHMKLALQHHPNPDDVIVFLGTNHYWQNQKNAPPTATVTDLLKGTNCIWVGNTAVHGKKWPVNGLIRDQVTPQCSYFDTEAADIPLFDGVHPGPTGAVKWLRLVWATIPAKYEEADQ
jgi:hypothetical protein